MNTDRTELVVLAFAKEYDADDALAALQQLENDGSIDLLDATVLSKNDRGELYVNEQAETRGTRRSRRIGVLGGALLGLLGGPIGAVVGGIAGGVVGNARAKRIDFGMTDDEVMDLSDALKPGTSAIVALVDHRWVDRVLDRMADVRARFESEIIRQQVKNDIADQLDEISA